MSTPHVCTGPGLGLGVRVTVTGKTGAEYVVEACCFAEAQRQYAPLLEADERRWEAEAAERVFTPPCLRALGLRGNATVADVKKAYRRLCHQLHPDHGGDAAAFRQLQADYEAALAYVEQPQGQAA